MAIHLRLVRSQDIATPRGSDRWRYCTVGSSSPCGRVVYVLQIVSEPAWAWLWR